MGFLEDWERESSFSTASGKELPYVVFQVTLKEKFLGTGSGNLTELEEVINRLARKGYRLHSISTAHTDSKGFGGGDRIQATLVFERVDIDAILLKWSKEYSEGIDTEKYLEKLNVDEKAEKTTDAPHYTISKWSTDDPFWAKCPKCGQRFPSSYLQSSQQCPACGCHT